MVRVGRDGERFAEGSWRTGRRGVEANGSPTGARRRTGRRQGLDGERVADRGSTANGSPTGARRRTGRRGVVANGSPRGRGERFAEGSRRTGRRGVVANGSPRGRGERVAEGSWLVSIHAPRVGRVRLCGYSILEVGFNSRVPRGARQVLRIRQYREPVSIHASRVGRVEGRGGYTSRGRARARGSGRRGGSETTPLSLRFFDPRVARLTRENYAKKKFFCGWCTMGKIRKNPNKIGVFGG